MIFLNLWSPVNSYVENERSVNKVLISRMRETVECMMRFFAFVEEILKIE